MAEISILICTYKRTELLSNCLMHVFGQIISRKMEIIVIDNDMNCSAKSIINLFNDLAKEKNIDLIYDIEPIQNISLARNLAINKSKGKYILFIDDDEYPDIEWIQKHIETMELFKCDGVFGPVINILPYDAPRWMIKSSIFNEIINFKTGSNIINMRGTGNLLIKRDALTKRNGPFNPEFGKTGSEDSDLLIWLFNNGCKFCWCNEAIVYQVLDSKRISLPYYIKRNFQFGINCSKIFYDQNNLIWERWILWPLRIILGLFKNIFYFISKLIINPKGSLFYFVGQLSTQLGKISYFLKIRIDLYK